MDVCAWMQLCGINAQTRRLPCSPPWLCGKEFWVITTASRIPATCSSEVVQAHTIYQQVLSVRQRVLARIRQGLPHGHAVASPHPPACLGMMQCCFYGCLLLLLAYCGYFSSFMCWLLKAMLHLCKHMDVLHSAPLDTYSVMGFLGHMTVLFLIIW